MVAVDVLTVTADWGLVETSPPNDELAIKTKL